MATSTLGPYQLLELLRSGGGGSVYRARDTRSGVLVALKTATTTSPSAGAGLRREIASLMILSEAGIDGVVGLIEHGIHDGTPWFAMQLVDGSNLRDFARTLWQPSAFAALDVSGTEPTVPVKNVRKTQSHLLATTRAINPSERNRRTLELARRIAMTLNQVHALGLLHGDLSPGNILVCEHDKPTLLDFGTSFAVFERSQFREPARRGFERYGTPGYVAPELWLGQSVDLRCDVYSLGCVLFELLFGGPVRGAVAPERQLRHLIETGRAHDADEIPTSVARMVLHMLAPAPSERVSDLSAVVQVISEALGETIGSTSSPARSLLLRPRLVGRAEPTAALERNLESTLCDGGRTVLIIAPSGTGKTRLLNEFGALAESRGTTVIACPAMAPNSLRSTASPGLSLLRPLFEHSVQHYKHREEHGDAPLTKEAWSLLSGTLHPFAPELFAAQEISPSLAPDKQRQRIFDAIESLISMLAEVRGCVLLFDDLQWADELSIAMLAERAPRLATHRVFYVGAIRDDAEPKRTEAVRTWANESVRLESLPKQQTAELIKDLLGVEILPEGLIDYVDAKAEGNPFFVGEYLREVLHAGLLRRGANAWDFPTPSALRLLNVNTPTSIEGLLSERLARLSPHANQILSRAAIIGREFTEELLGNVESEGDFERARALHELTAAQLIVPLADAQYRFVHDRLREAAASLLPNHVQVELHRAIALALEARTSKTTAMLARLGHHWFASGEYDKASTYFEDAASRAQAEHDLDFACELYRSALLSFSNSKAVEARESEARINETLGDCLLQRACHVEGRQCFLASFALSSEGSSLRRARLKRKEAATYWTLHDYANAEQALRDGAAILGTPFEAEQAVWQEHIQIQLGRFEYLYFAQRNGSEIAELVGALEDPVQRYGTPRQRNAFYVVSSSFHLLRGRYAFSEKALELARLGVEASTELAPDMQALAHLGYAFASFFGTVEQCRQGLQIAESSVRWAREAQGATLLARTVTYHLLLLVRIGELERVADAAIQAKPAIEAARLPPYQATLLAVSGWLDWRCGRVTASTNLEKALAIWRAHPHPFPLRWLALFPALALSIDAANFAQARALLDELVEPAQQALPAPLLDAIAAARLAAESGDFAATPLLLKVVSVARALHFA